LSEDDFYGPEWDLANIAANSTYSDGFLEDLVDLAEAGLGSVIGVLANGMVIVGAIATGRAIAERLDKLLEPMTGDVDPPDDLSPEDWEDRLRFWATRNTRAYDEAVEERTMIDERLQAEGNPAFGWETRPQGLAREALENRIRTTLTLVNVQVIAPGQRGALKTDVLRVPLKQIAGWWPIPVDSEGKASLQLFATEDE